MRVAHLPAACRAASVAFVLSTGTAAAGEALPGLAATPVEIGAGTVDGITALGAWEMTAGAEAFGGLSGLLSDGRTLLVLSDRGTLIEIALGPDGMPGRQPEARLHRLTEEGRRLERGGRDGEALARLPGGGLAAAFERDHRVARIDPRGRIGAETRHAAFERLPSNGGLEALASLPDGRLIAIAETPDDRGFPLYILDPTDGLVAEARLPAPSRHRVTGADLGPDGRLYVVYRDFSFLTGVSIVLRRFDIAGEPPLPVAGSAATLGRWGQASGIDNMEAVALDRGADGALRLWLLSDDNFNPLQRTLLMLFAVGG